MMAMNNRSLSSLHSWIILVILSILSITSVYAATIRTVEATIIKVSDGDTVQAVTPEGTKLKVRLYGIDAPEAEKGNKKTGKISKHEEPFGKEAKHYLSSMIFKKNVRIDIIDIDRYRRMVGVIWLGDKNVNLEMIRAGMAEAYREYLREPYRKQFIQAEKEAKAIGKGIWSQGESYVRPSEFRKRMGIGGT